MWICNKCKSEVENNFDVCWNCGNDEKEISAANQDSNEQVSFSETYQDTAEDNDGDSFIDIKSLEASVKKRFFNCFVDSIVIILLAMALSILTGDEEIGLFFVTFYFLLLLSSI